MVETIIARPSIGVPKAKSITISSTTTGSVYTIKHLLGASSTLSLIGATNSNLTLSGDNIVVGTALGTGASQKAIVREVLGDIAVEFSVTINTAAAPPSSVFGSGTWNDGGTWNDTDTWRDAA